METVEADAYQMLFVNIRDDLFPNPRVLTMIELQLTASLVLYMNPRVLTMIELQLTASLVLYMNPRVLTMIELQLTASLVLYMKAHGVEEVQASTKKHIRRKLQGEFGESLLIFPDDIGKLLVIPDNLKITTLAAKQMRMKGELNSPKEGNTDPLQLIQKAAVYIRAELKKSEAEATLVGQNKPLNPFLTGFFKTLVAGDSEKP